MGQIIAKWTALAVLFCLCSTSGKSQTIPPCCTTPPIVSDLTSRPPGETDQQLRGWLSQRSRGKSDSEISLELTAIEGACTRGCSDNFRSAQTFLVSELQARQQGPDNDYGAPCCGEPKAPARPVPRPPSSPLRVPAQLPPDPGGQPFRSEIIRALSTWTGQPDDVPGWLGAAEPLTVERLAHLQQALAGWCTPTRECPAAMVIGRQTVERMLELKQREAEQQENEAARAQEASLRRGDWFATILSGIIGGIIGFAECAFDACTRPQRRGSASSFFASHVGSPRQNHFPSQPQQISTEQIWQEAALAAEQL